jgi:hypothetical protein
MSNSTDEPVAKNPAAAPPKRGPAAAPAAKAATQFPAPSLHQVESIVKTTAEAVRDSGASSVAAFQELAKAYQELASRNAENLTAAMQALAAVKSPTEFFALQQRLMTEGVEAAVADGQQIAKLTSAVFAAAFAPVQKQIEALQKMPRS